MCPFVIFSDIAEQLNADDELRVTLLICDMVERHYLRGMNAIAAKFGCEVCKTPAETKGGVHWPYPKCLAGETRTMEECKHYARYIASKSPVVC